MDECPICGKSAAVCVCDVAEPVDRGRTRIVVLQHPQEQDRVLGTAPILERVVRASRRVGLSWPNLAAATGDPEAIPSEWAVIWPSQLPRALTEVEAAARAAIVTAGPAPMPTGLLVLDGTWSQAKTLWWRNAWLLKLGRIVIHPREPSIYGRLRREPRPEFVSTLEAVAEALVAVGEPEAARIALRKAMRTMVQRARDAGPPRG